MIETMLFLLGILLGTALGYVIHAEKVRKTQKRVKTEKYDVPS